MNIKRIVLLLVGLILLMAGCQSGNEDGGQTAVPTNTLVVVTAEPSEEAQTTEVSAEPTVMAEPEMATMTETVDIDLFLYQPRAITVTVGTAVTWVNHDDIQHSVTNGTPDEMGDAFDSGFFFLDESYSFTFSEPGMYQYFCLRHNHMQGTVEVVEEGG